MRKRVGIPLGGITSNGVHAVFLPLVCVLLQFVLALSLIVPVFVQHRPQLGIYLYILRVFSSGGVLRYSTPSGSIFFPTK